jgi:RHS repeat-associated protein
VKKVVRTQRGAFESTVYIDGAFEHHRWKRNGEEPDANNRLHVMTEQQRIVTVRVGDPHPEDKGPDVQYAFGDHLGSSNGVISADGSFVNHEEYTPYGEVSFGSFARKRYRFTGMERDEESGLYYHGARYLAPWLGRWVTCDPAGAIEGLSMYVYAIANPMRGTDGHGLQTKDVTHAQVSNIDLEGTSEAEVRLWDEDWPGWREGAIRIHGTARELNVGEFELDVADAMLDNRISQAEGHKLWERHPEFMSVWSVSSRSVGRITAAAREAAVTAQLSRNMFQAVEAMIYYTTRFTPGTGPLWALYDALKTGEEIEKAETLEEKLRLTVDSISPLGPPAGGGGGRVGQTATPKPWKITNPAATKIVGGRTYLKDGKTGLWWSRDTAGHGGSAWKVYTEKGGVLKWFRDADMQGNFIDPAVKWKGPVGKTIR